jgi:hypothetical protein
MSLNDVNRELSIPVWVSQMHNATAYVFFADAKCAQNLIGGKSVGAHKPRQKSGARMSLSDPARLFAGTAFSGAVQSQICGDLCEVRNFFPSLRAFRYVRPGASTAMILVQGEIPISFGGDDDFPVPLNIRLLDTYPGSAPLVQIPRCPAGRAFAPSRFLDERGTVCVPALYAWDAGAPSLAGLIAAIYAAFSGTAPFTDAPAPAPAPAPPRPRPDFAVFQAEAESLVNAANDRIARAHAVTAAAMEMAAYEQSALAAQARGRAEVAELAQIIALLPPPEEPPVDAPPGFAAAAAPRARREAHAVAQAALGSAFAERAISLDQMVRATRELARKFFADTLYDLLQTG